MARRALILMCWLCASATALAQNWPSFRGPAASGVADGTPTAVKWNAATGENVLWKTPVPGVAVSSPIVWGERVYVSTAVSSDASAGIRTGLYGDVEPAKDVSKHTWKLVALDARSGKVVWERVAHEGIPKTKRHPKSSQASATPVTDGRRVIVSFGSEGLYADGWARRGPTGTIGTNRPDGYEVAELVALASPPGSDGGKPGGDALTTLLEARGVQATSFDDWRRIEEAEVANARRGSPREKFVRVDEWLGTLRRQ